MSRISQVFSTDQMSTRGQRPEVQTSRLGTCVPGTENCARANWRSHNSPSSLGSCAALSRRRLDHSLVLLNISVANSKDIQKYPVVSAHRGRSL
ncbi:hypothetical protein HBI56_082150 [Parastagonospora nodorum]|nr:hypothetical protein HBH52_126860 [Parastagonospora nodorum]KAH3978747.1 hypothetical protein HBH51_063780 [Parastagonospora nodorum]KAH3999054.1 hypothetical protein HBI10_120420 [Parastagonospora nodorum]KAH4025047.1 hypothetical protein HBI13_076770 [Parastagonospora nodorum]KAH4032399.1 hypothetical protein HBI09_118400 [Parastagonospora nodorum]